jgi:tRNA A37 methylthiotransferase MiaB
MKKKSKERLKIFQDTADIIKRKYRKKILNTTVNVLFENKLDGNKYFGRDEYSNSVIVENENNIEGNIFDVKITNFNHNTLFGKIIKNKNYVAA